MTRLTWIEGAVDDPGVPIRDASLLAVKHVLQLDRMASAGVVATTRGYPRPSGRRARALVAAAQTLFDGKPSLERTLK